MVNWLACVGYTAIDPAGQSEATKQLYVNVPLVPAVVVFESLVVRSRPPKRMKFFVNWIEV
jgi:hypothetical protein